MPSISEKRKAFRALHERGCFVIPNPWDIGSARWLQGMGFKALASTSSGFAWSKGYADSHVTRDIVLQHLAELVAATDVPINADFESGYAHNPAEVGANVKLAIETGIAGVSIEDSTGDKDKPLYDIDDAVARMKAARKAIDETGGDTMLIGRAENFFAGVPDLDDTIARLKAYSNAGADCLYSPGVKTREQIAAVVKAVAPKPFNLLIGNPIGISVKDAEALGVRRISVGGALARSAWGGFTRAVKQIVEEGRFDEFANAAPGAELNKFFNADRK
jgi:2-methylisocitrate lyase-like PEP mutase family enzyme